MTATTLSPREMKRRRKQGADYVPPSPYTVKAALTHGDVLTKLSAVVFGLGNIVRKQYVKGIAMLALEVAFFVFMATNGVGYLSKLPSLGENKGGKKLVDGFWQYVEPDRSVVIPALRRGVPRDLRGLRRPVGHVGAFRIQVPGAA